MTVFVNLKDIIWLTVFVGVFLMVFVPHFWRNRK